MSCKTCTTCNERKPIEMFAKDFLCAGGYGFKCQDCKNAAKKKAAAKSKVKCPNCDGTYSRASLAGHMKTKKCINGVVEWKHPMKSKDRFKYNGKRYVICPCKHKGCSVNIRESSAYRHMKYGMDNRKAPFDLTKNMTVTWIDSDYESERDL